MLINTQDIEIYENGSLTKEYKRKQAAKRLKYTLTLLQLITAHYTLKAGKYTANKIDEILRPVRLDMIDHVYGTSLRSQYFAGKRSQAILRTKRQYGLM